MQNILTGIYAAYSGDTALKAAITGGLYLEQAPQGAALPYATYFTVAGRPDYWLGALMYEMLTAQFDIYADTDAERQTAYTALTALYDDLRPTVTGYTAVIMERNFQQMLRDGDQDQYFRATVTYECRFEKT